LLNGRTVVAIAGNNGKYVSCLGIAVRITRKCRHNSSINLFFFIGDITIFNNNFEPGLSGNFQIESF